MWTIYNDVFTSINTGKNMNDQDGMNDQNNRDSMNISPKNNNKTIRIKIKNIQHKKKKNISNLCITCNSNTLIFDDNIICSKCGTINSFIIDHNQEWRYYGVDDSKRLADPTRCGMPINPLLPNSSLGTIINGNGYEVFRRLHRWNSITYKERSLIKVFNTISAKGREGTIPTCIIDKASLMYKMLSENNIKRGSSRKSLIAACLWNALKAKDISRSTKEIAKLFDIDIKKMTIGCKEFNEKMHLKDKDFSVQLKPATATNYINRYTVKLKMPEEYKIKAIKIAKLSEKLGIVTKNTPQSIAVGSIYLVSQQYNLGYSKKILHKICETSEVTISKAFKELDKYKKFLFTV
jgi:transcription initiation factor TFIIB